MYSTEFNLKGKNVKLSKEKLLTIGIITKNECEKLERCLKSLIPIKEALDCEIIVTDTGSTDNTVEMSKKYADKVIKFDWIDDFSAARNTGIEASKGLWFMWIDSDEWVDDPKPLIEFFKTGEYKKYASATIEMMEYEKASNEISAKLTLCRLVLLNRDNKFRGVIHETLDILEPLKKLKTGVYHDGYSIESKDDRQLKHIRNIELLLKQNKKFPEDINIIRYIVDQYRFIDDFENSNKFCDKAIDLIEKSDITSTKLKELNYLHFIIMKAANLLSLDELEATIELLMKIETINECSQIRCFLDIYFILSESFFRLRNKEKSEEFAKKYIDHYMSMNQIEDIYVTKFYEISNKTDILRKMFYLSIGYLHSNHMEDCILDYLENFRTARYENGIPQSKNEYIESILEIVNITKKYELIESFYRKVILRDEYDECIDLNQFKNIVYSIMSMNKDKIEELLNLVIYFDKTEELQSIAKFIKYDLEGKTEDAKKEIYKILDSKNIINKHVQIEVIYGILKYDIDFRKILNDVDAYLVPNLFEFELRKKTDFLEIALDYYYKNLYLQNNIKYNIILLNIVDFYISNNKIDDILGMKIYDFFENVIPKTSKFIYGDSIIENNIDIYPPVYRFGYFIKIANEKKQNDLIEYIKLLKNAVLHYPNMDRAIKIIVNKIEKDIVLENKKKLEFEELSVKIKQKIYELITLGESEEALTVVCQLQSIMPNDKELKELKSRLTSF